MKWPLGLCPEMDKMAADNGLSHWSCALPKSNQAWIRRDGVDYVCYFDKEGGWPAELKAIDDKFQLGSDFANFAGGSA